MKNLEATEAEIFAKEYEKFKILAEFLGTKFINLDDYTCPKVQFLLFKDEEYDWSCSNYPFRRAKTLHCAEGKAFAYGTCTRSFFKHVVKHNNLNVLLLKILIQFPCQRFLFGDKIVDQCDKSVNLGNFVFDEKNHERKSCKRFGRTCNRSLLVFCANFLLNF